MEPHFGCVTIIGVGILGGSIGRALKERHMADRIIGVGHREISLQKALALNAIDEGSLDVPTAVKEADFIVLATPAALVIQQLDSIHANCRQDAMVTDVASTKAAICDHACRTWSRPRRFIGSHPMAGSEKFGPEFSVPDFYENTVCLVEQLSDGLDPTARETIVAFWQALGARVIDIDPAQHDRILAHTSHIPHIVAAALATGAVSKGKIKDLIGNGFKDTTRIAGSRPEVWRDICLTNREAILEGLQEFIGTTQTFHTLLKNNDADGLYAYFDEGRKSRKKAVEE